MTTGGTKARRRTTQVLMPARPGPASSGSYDLYPAHPLPSGLIGLGFAALAARLAGSRRVLLDGFAGVLWNELRAGLDAALLERGLRAAWLPAATALLEPAFLEPRLAPFLGGDDPLFGTRFSGSLADCFDAVRLLTLKPDENADLTVLYGPGAALAGWEDALLVYVDLPKNELQFRARAGVPTNLGLEEALDPKAAYKRSYFVDWPVLNRHKAELLGRADLFVDGQRPDEPTFIEGADLRSGLEHMARTWFRPRPWFEPGPWGGQWLGRHVPELPQDVPNYAWSFELIAPENGLLFESDGLLLECSLDCLMFQASEAVLGEAAERFGHEFPIRFDFLDTVEGGNLSVQCHPRPEYIKEHFGESFTQDETYYILDCEPGARVYLGFQEGVNPAEFRASLERSQETGEPVTVERFVQSFPAERGDLFLIPSGTVHCSGVGNLVLEISATPYIFTFKMYDWLRLDLEGKPRPLNIARAYENLDFSRRGERVEQEFVSRPALIETGEGWRLVHLPTHEEHFYDVHRLELEVGASVEVDTENRCHVLMLVSGEAVGLTVGGAPPGRFHLAETFVVPAAAGRYRLTNEGGGEAKVLKAFVKPRRGPGP